MSLAIFMFLVVLGVQALDSTRAGKDDVLIPPPKCFSHTNMHNEDGPQCFSISKAARGQSRSVERSLATWPTCGVSTVIPRDKRGSCAADAQKALDIHNRARKNWGANPLLWSKTLADYAQGVSNTCKFQHSNGPYGENLAIGTNMNCSQAVKLWLAEKQYYPPGGTPGYSSQTGHFTAAVWKNTKQVGCGIKSCSNGKFVTCSYYQQGNIIGQFDKQVGFAGEKPGCLPVK